MYLKLFGGRLKISLLLFPAGIAAFFFYSPQQLFAFFAAIVLHEAAHALVIRAVGARITSIEVLPFGCAANHDGFFNSGAKEAAAASAGPVINIVTAAAAKLIFKDDEFSQLFVNVSTGLAAVNMLPVLPMDGGRVFAAVLGLFVKRSAAHKTVSIMGIAAGAFVIALFTVFAVKGSFNFSLIVMGVFMVISSVSHLKNSQLEFAKCTVEKRRALNSKSHINVNHIAIDGSRTIAETIRGFDPRKYNIVHVVGNDLKVEKTLDEGAVFERMMQDGAGSKLKK
ncbi:MAG: hypothetical protein IJD14_02285 [Christensenellaceae bacterium]|nr:hypothetical protein [Christensenellaceae bacterium]